MSSVRRDITLNLVGNDKASKAFESAGKAAEKASSRSEKFAAGVEKMSAPAKKVAAGLAVVGVASVKLASDAEQSMGATQTVFGKAAETIIKKSKQAATTVGLSANQYREAANQIGSLLGNKGLKGDALTKATDELIKKGADLSATFGGTATEAVEALSSAFKGEFDPLEKYGISLNQTAVNTEAGRIAQEKYGKALKDLSETQQTAIKRQATQDLINKQSAKTTGAFAKESDTLAHKQQVLMAQLQDLGVAIGTALLPALSKMGDLLSKAVTFATEHSTATKIMLTVIAALAGTILTLNAGIKAYTAVTKTAAIASKIWNGSNLILGARLKAIDATTKTSTAATKAWAAAQRLAAAAVRGVIAGAKALAAAVLASAKAMLSGVKQAAAWALAQARTAASTVAATAAMVAQRGVQLAIAAGLKVWAAAQWLLNAALLANPIVLIVAGIIALVAIIAVIVQKTIGWGKIWDWLKSVASKAWDAIKKGISSLVAWFASLPGRIKKAVGNLGKLLLDKGKDILRGLLNGAKWLWDHSLVGYIVNRRQAIVRALGNVGRLLYQKGKDILNGLKRGAQWVFDHTVRPYLRLGSKIKNAVGSLGSVLYGAGKAVLKGLYDGLVWAWKNYVQPYLSWVTDRIPDWKGPKVRDAKLLVESGRLIMGSLVKGFDDGAGKVESYLNRFTSGIPGMVEVSATGLTPIGAGGGLQTVTVRLTAEQVSQLQRGREIQADLDAYRSAGGRKRS